METTPATKASFDAASLLFGRLTREAAGPDGNWCVPEPVQQEIARKVVEQTGWTLAELRAVAGCSSDPGSVTVTVPVDRHTDVNVLARRMADHSRRGGQVVLYPANPFR